MNGWACLPRGAGLVFEGKSFQKISNKPLRDSTRDGDTQGGEEIDGVNMAGECLRGLLYPAGSYHR